MKMKKLISILLLLVSGNLCLGQQAIIFPEIFKQESIIYLTDTLIRNEISLFNVNSFTATNTNIHFRPKLSEIPLEVCTDSSAFFHKGNLYASEIIVHISSENINSTSRIKEVNFFHYKYGITLPDSAISGLYQPKFCSELQNSKSAVSSNCRVFRSEDKRRVYIYMLNGDGNASYEVTWIIKDSKYFKRIIDKVN